MHASDRDFEKTNRFYRLYRSDSNNGTEFYQNVRGDIYAWRSDDDSAKTVIGNAAQENLLP